MTKGQIGRALAAIVVLMVIALLLDQYLGRSSMSAATTNKITSPSMETFTLASPAFKNGETIPAKYTCDMPSPDGLHTSPPFIIMNVPSGTKSLVLMMNDPDVPKEKRPSGNFDHWVVYNIKPEVSVIEENEIFGVVGGNGRGEKKYAGPCPPPEYQPSTHRYYFRLYALDTELALAEGAQRPEVLTAIEGHVLAEAELMGKYDRTHTLEK